MAKASKQAVPGHAGEVCGTPEGGVDTVCVPVPPLQSPTALWDPRGFIVFQAGGAPRASSEHQMGRDDERGIGMKGFPPGC